MFTFVVKIHPRQPINHIYILRNESTKWIQWMLFKTPLTTITPLLPKGNEKGKVEFVLETLSERIPYIYISKQPSLSCVGFEGLWFLHDPQVNFLWGSLGVVLCLVLEAMLPSCLAVLGLYRPRPTWSIAVVVLIFSFQNIKCRRKQTHYPPWYK